MTLEDLKTIYNVLEDSLLKDKIKLLIEKQELQEEVHKKALDIDSKLREIYEKEKEENEDA